MRVCCKCGEEIFPGQEAKGRGKTMRHGRPGCSRAKLRLTGPVERLISSRVEKSLTEIRRCWNSCGFEGSTIYPGDEYIRELWRVPCGEYWEKKTKLEVRFFHYPQCPLPDFDEDECCGSGEISQTRKKSGIRSCQAPLRRAA